MGKGKESFRHGGPYTSTYLNLCLIARPPLFDQEEEIAVMNPNVVEETREFIGADSLAYLSCEGMIRATGLPESRFSTSCFSGAYPVDIGDRAIAGPLKGALSTCRRPA